MAAKSPTPPPCNRCHPPLLPPSPPKTGRSIENTVINELKAQNAILKAKLEAKENEEKTRSIRDSFVRYACGDDIEIRGAFYMDGPIPVQGLPEEVVQLVKLDPRIHTVVVIRDIGELKNWGEVWKRENS